MKLLIILACLAPAIEGSDHLEPNTIVDLPPDTARAIVHAGKALYVDPKDDPSKLKVNTAPEARIEAVRKAIKAAARAGARKGAAGDEPPPGDA